MTPDDEDSDDSDELEVIAFVLELFDEELRLLEEELDETRHSTLIPLFICPPVNPVLSQTAILVPSAEDDIAHQTLSGPIFVQVTP